LVFHWFSLVFHCIPLVFHWIPLIFHWISFGFPLVFIGIPLDSFCIPLEPFNMHWISLSFALVFIGIPLDSFCIPLDSFNIQLDFLGRGAQQVPRLPRDVGHLDPAPLLQEVDVALLLLRAESHRTIDAATTMSASEICRTDTRARSAASCSSTVVSPSPTNFARSASHCLAMCAGQSTSVPARRARALSRRARALSRTAAQSFRETAWLAGWLPGWLAG